MSNDDLFEGLIGDDGELSTPSNTEVGTKDVISTGVSPTDPEWNDYVLGHFEKNEMFEKMPLCNGLRRVAELLMGRIVFSGPTQVFPPQGGNEIGRATVVWRIEFEDGSAFSDVADSWEGNTDDTFCVYNTATAATRAEGRALRKALRIRVVAAEEVTKKNTAAIAKSISLTKSIASTEGEYNDSERMTEKQENFIGNIKCKQLNVDVIKFFKEVLKVDIKKKVTKGQASDAIQKLNEYQANKSLIPDSITGYDSDWRN